MRQLDKNIISVAKSKGIFSIFSGKIGICAVKNGHTRIGWTGISESRYCFRFRGEIMLTVAKFGGSSLAGAECFARVRQIVLSDPSRRVIVVSAAGKRHSGDQKITDLLYLCHAHLQYGASCWELWRRVSERYLEIRDGCALQIPIEQELEAIYASLSPATGRDYLASRGEYLSARLMAELLGFAFVDAAEWLRFDCAGRVLYDESYAALQSLADGRKIVTPGFYGRLPSGAIHTFSRGGSDITGSLAAAALHADVYENWTDVPGVLAADPAIVPQPRTTPYLSYRELQALAGVGMQVLHGEAVEPVRARQIPLHIRSTFAPETAGTRIGIAPAEHGGAAENVAFAGRRRLAMLRISGLAPEKTARVPEMLAKEGLPVFQFSAALGEATALVETPDGSDALHAGAERLRAALGTGALKLRENLSVLAALYRGAEAVSRVITAVQNAGVPIHHMIEAAQCLMMVVNDSQYEAALRAAYAER